MNIISDGEGKRVIAEKVTAWCVDTDHREYIVVYFSGGWVTMKMSPETMDQLMLESAVREE